DSSQATTRAVSGGQRYCGSGDDHVASAARSSGGVTKLSREASTTRRGRERSRSSSSAATSSAVAYPRVARAAYWYTNRVAERRSARTSTSDRDPHTSTVSPGRVLAPTYAPASRAIPSSRSSASPEGSRRRRPWAIASRRSVAVAYAVYAAL